MISYDRINSSELINEKTALIETGVLVVFAVVVIVNLILLIPFLILAIFLSKGKGAFLIAGYNTMPAEEKAQYDEAALCKFMAKIMYGLCFSIFLWGLSELLQMQVLFIVGLVLFMGFIGFALVYLNTGNRFKRNLDDKTDDGAKGN